MNLETSNKVTLVAASSQGLGKALAMGKPEELASLVVFLGSEMASYITGVSVQVDGGSVQGLY